MTRAYNLPPVPVEAGQKECPLSCPVVLEQHTFVFCCRSYDAQRLELNGEGWPLRCAACLASERPAPAPALSVPEPLDAILADIYVCGRAWSAWQAGVLGTMEQDDFAPAIESTELVEALLKWRDDHAAALLAERPEPEPRGEPCPPREYVLWMEQQAEIAEIRTEVARLEAERDALREQLAALPPHPAAAPQPAPGGEGDE